MFLGILIGLMLWGILITWSNWDAGIEGVNARSIGSLAMLIGFCGSIAWIIEVSL